MQFQKSQTQAEMKIKLDYRDGEVRLDCIAFRKGERDKKTATMGMRTRLNYWQ